MYARSHLIAGLAVRLLVSAGDRDLEGAVHRAARLVELSEELYPPTDRVLKRGDCLPS